MTPYRPEVRFADIDAMGIVNNATFLTYFEQARIQFFGELVGREWDWHAAGVVVARHAIDYRSPIRFGDRVEIRTRITAVGTKSLTVAYDVEALEGDAVRTVAHAETVLVGFDHHSGKSVAIPEVWRTALAAQG
ncbi:MAG: acyl-CoA thioesterase [Flavobacteriales bacterium]|jgi:acyl-CoA thioester hydrolase